MINERVEVIGTVREPDGTLSGAIDGVVFRRQGGVEIMRKPRAVEAAKKNLLSCRPPGGGKVVNIAPRDFDGDGQDDAVATVADDTPTNNLRRLNILAVKSRGWVDCEGTMLGSALDDGGLWEDGIRLP